MIKFRIIALLLAFFMLSPITVYASQPREIQFEHALNRAARETASNLDFESRQEAARARELRNLRANINDVEERDVIDHQVLVAQAESAHLLRESVRVRISADLQMRTHLANIHGFELQIQLLEQTIELQERALEQTELRRQHGMASDVNVREAYHTLGQSRINLETVQLSLQNERQSLNRLINQPITANIQIVYDISNIPALPEGVDSDRSINSQIARNPELLRLQDEVEIRRHYRQINRYNPLVDNRYTRVQHQMATFERDMAERQAEQSVRAALAEWERLLEQYEAIQADLAQAQQEYENMQNRFEAGLVTQIQVDQAALGVASQEIALATHSYAFWIARLRIDHPYVR